MKTLNRICQVLAIILGLASLVLFFTDFAKIVTAGETKTFVGSQLAFGGGELGIAKSAHFLFCFWLTVIAAVMSIFSFKTKKLRYAAPAFGLVAGVYMLVIALSRATKFIDRRPLTNITKVEYTPFVLITALVLLAFAVLAIAYLLIDDYIEVKASKGEKLTIPKRIIRFFRDYKSEVKKIVWPGWKEVAKNTGIVLIMCLIIGALIWVVDYGLGQLIKLILGV